MKKKRLLYSIVCLVAFSTFLVGCNERGLQGPQGVPGEQGEPGQDGKDGTSVRTGNDVPSNDLGKNGDSYIDLTTWDYYVKENGSWILKGNIKGEDSSNDNPQGLAFYPLDDGTFGVGAGNALQLSKITVPSTYQDKEVTKIIDYGFGDISPEFHIARPKCKIMHLPNTLKEIGKYGLYGCTYLESIVISNSVTTIGDSAISNCTSLTSVFYKGTGSEWLSIDFGNYNYSLDNATIYYYSETEPTEEGNYWHYADENPTPWN